MNNCSCKDGCSCKAGCNCTNCKCNTYADYFDVFANSNRMRIIESLQDRPKNVSQIIASTGIEQTYVSHSLKKLESKKIVIAMREGKFKVYSLNKAMITPLFKALQQNITVQKKSTKKQTAIPTKTSKVKK